MNVMEQTRLYNLLVSNKYPEKVFIKNFGQELFDKLKEESFAIDKGCCAGCGHEPPEYRKKDCLFFHIDEVNEKNPELTKGVTLCKMCHITQHIEVAIKKKWIIFVNAIYDQNTLVIQTRGGKIHEAICRRSIVPLQKSPEQFLKEWFAGEVKFTPTLKVTFTNNFNIDDLY